MGIVRKTISLPEEQDAWVKAQVASGRFASDSEVHRALVNLFKDADQKRDELAAAVKAGFESGYVDQSISEIVADIKSEAAKRRNSNAA